jgi:hypothetical protein
MGRKALLNWDDLTPSGREFIARTSPHDPRIPEDYYTNPFGLSRDLALIAEVELEQKARYAAEGKKWYVKKRLEPKKPAIPLEILKRRQEQQVLQNLAKKLANELSDMTPFEVGQLYYQLVDSDNDNSQQMAKAIRLIFKDLT